MTPHDRPAPTEEDLLRAGADLAAAFDVAARRATAINERLAWVGEQVRDGARIADLVRNGERLTLLDATNETLEALLTAGTRLRRLCAQTMYAEGMTMDEIAGVLGVTRQRVSKLLSADPETPGPLWRRFRE